MADVLKTPWLEELVCRTVSTMDKSMSAKLIGSGEQHVQITAVNALNLEAESCFSNMKEIHPQLPQNHYDDDKSEASDMLATFSDSHHDVRGYFTASAVNSYKQYLNILCGRFILNTCSVDTTVPFMRLTGAIITLKKFHLVSNIVERRSLRVVLYVQEFEIYGSEGEPTFGNPTLVSESRKVVAEAQKAVNPCTRVFKIWSRSMLTNLDLEHPSVNLSAFCTFISLTYSSAPTSSTSQFDSRSANCWPIAKRLGCKSAVLLLWI